MRTKTVATVASTHDGVNSSVLTELLYLAMMHRVAQLPCLLTNQIFERSVASSRTLHTGVGLQMATMGNLIRPKNPEMWALSTGHYVAGAAHPPLQYPHLRTDSRLINRVHELEKRLPSSSVSDGVVVQVCGADQTINTTQLNSPHQKIRRRVVSPSEIKHHH